MAIHFTDAAGWVGMAMLLAGYAWRKKLSAQAYNGLNVVGAVLLVVVCVAREVWPPAVLNVIWAGIGLRDMVRAWRGGLGSAGLGGEGEDTRGA